MKDASILMLITDPGARFCLSIRRNSRLSGGTQSPVTIPVQGFATGLPIRAFGTFGCKVSDYIAAMDKYAGVRTVYTTDDLRDRVVSVLGSLLMKWITKEGRDIFNLQMNAKRNCGRH